MTARIPVTVAAFAVALMGLLPDAHMHTGGDQRMVHRHVITEATIHRHESPVVHSGDHDHSDAHTLTYSFEVGGRLAIPVGLAVASQFVADSQSAHASVVSGTTLLPTHDPPLRFTSSPAPPAVV